MLKKNDIEAQAYRDAMARFAGAVHVVTTDGEAGLRGTTVIAACSVSDAPPMILVCVNRANARNELFVENGRFALNTLSAAQEPLAVAMSGVTNLSTEERFALGTWDTLSSGAPTLVGALAVFDCDLVDTKDLATHRVLFDPLLYFNRSYRVL